MTRETLGIEVERREEQKKHMKRYRKRKTWLERQSSKIVGKVITQFFLFILRRKAVRILDPEFERLLMTETLSYDTVNVFYRRSITIAT